MLTTERKYWDRKKSMLEFSIEMPVLRVQQQIFTQIYVFMYNNLFEYATILVF